MEQSIDREPNPRVLSRRLLDCGPSSIEVVVGGAGDAIVLLPGLGCAADHFDAISPWLHEAGLQTLAVTLRGIGESRGPLDNLSLHDLADDVARVLRALEIERAHVLGWAFGNRVARCLAADRPDLVDGLILLAAGGRFAPEPKSLWRQGVQRVRSAFRLTSSRSRTWRRAVAAHQRASDTTPLSDWWTAGTAPILAIQGLRDTTAPPANGRALQAELRGRARLIELEDAGHSVLHEAPERISAEISRFLREIECRRTRERAALHNRSR